MRFGNKLYSVFIGKTQKWWDPSKRSNVSCRAPWKAIAEYREIFMEGLTFKAGKKHRISRHHRRRPAAPRRTVSGRRAAVAASEPWRAQGKTPAAARLHRIRRPSPPESPPPRQRSRRLVGRPSSRRWPNRAPPARTTSHSWSVCARRVMGPAPPLSVPARHCLKSELRPLPRSLRALPHVLTRHPPSRIASSQLEGYPQPPPSASSPPQSSPPLVGPDSSAADRTSFICGTQQQISN
ncbi:hypothetical protein Syun_030783 [Stephania yunnanensis]|uniref:Uncharacterized protein n=1 Tax=Stephania yunnanensis TaxID=152371 RepID=A0AAP0E293_9MAGN